MNKKEELHNHYRELLLSGGLPKNTTFEDYLIGRINAKDVAIKLLSDDMAKLMNSASDTNFTLK